MLALAFTCLAAAQTDTGRVVGSVLDTSGAVVPGAAITVRNDRTGQERKATSNDQGAFVVTQLSPAGYTITVKAEGFGVTERREVLVQVGQERPVNIVLQPASVSTEVVVSGGE
jgi:hypothetical protein